MKLSEKQQKFVDGVLTGKGRNRSALDAGYANSCPLDSSSRVRFEIAQAREKLSDLTTIKRVDVIDGIMDGIAMARMQGDSANVIKGWSEVAKILGHYAPEVKRIELSDNQQRIRSKFEALSDDELLAIQDASIIDVDAKLPN